MSYVPVPVGDDFLVSRTGKYNRNSRMITVNVTPGAGGTASGAATGGAVRPQAPCNPLVDKTCGPQTNTQPWQGGVTPPSSGTTPQTPPTPPVPTVPSGLSTHPKGTMGHRPPRKVVVVQQGSSTSTNGGGKVLPPIAPVATVPAPQVPDVVAVTTKPPWLLIAALAGGAYLLLKDS